MDTLLQGVSAFLLALLGAGLGPEAPTASFTIGPANPSAGSPVQFLDTSAGSPTSWQWDFGDGATSVAQNPTHAWAAPGIYPIRLTAGNAGGQTRATATVEVSPEETLRLISNHVFDVTLEARDPRTGNTGPGKAIPQNDIFGYFTIPALVPTGGPLVPEVFVKILDATAIGQNYWVFWGGLTDLDYTLTVRENATGVTKVYRNPVTETRACLGADTSGFGGEPTTTPTAASPTQTATRARTPTPTRTPTGTAPTPTQTPGAATVVRLRAVYWQWDFVAGPNVSSGPPYPGFNTITLRKGQKYEFHIYNDGPVLDPPLFPHYFSGVAAIGLSGASLETGGPEFVQTITPMMTGDFPYLCTDTECGTGPNQHDAMHGTVKVVP